MLPVLAPPVRLILLGVLGSIRVAGGLSAVPAEPELIVAITELRRIAQNCDGATYPPAPPLRSHAKLAAAADLILQQNTDHAFALAQVGAAGYLAWGATSIHFDGISLGVKAALRAWMNTPRACRAVMTPYSEAGYALRAGRLVLVLAEPFDAAARARYVARLFAEVNRTRRAGVNASSYPGALCASPPVHELVWNDRFAQAAQFHADDYAAKGVVSAGSPSSPSTGTAGDALADRLAAHGCAGASAVELTIFNGFLTPEQAVGGWVTMSKAHCAALVSPVSQAAGFGIAASNTLHHHALGPVGPFISFVQGTAASACATASRPAH